MDVSVVIVSYNTASYLKSCIEAIINKTKGPEFEIIVVDNASTDNSVAVAKAFGKKITLLEAKENRGFATGVNAGTKKATGKFILVLNPDTLFLDDAIGKMRDYRERRPDVGLAGCTLLDNEQKMLSNGGYFPTLIRIFFWTFFLDDLPFLDKLIKPYHLKATSNQLLATSNQFDWVTGSFMFVRREVLDKVGGLDENIFMYGEEVEWQYRMKLAGWKVGYTPVTRVVHYERKSSGGSPRNAILGEVRGLKYIYGKHFSGWKQIVLGSLLDLAAVNRIFLWLVRRNMEMVKIYLEALML